MITNDKEKEQARSVIAKFRSRMTYENIGTLFSTDATNGYRIDVQSPAKNQGQRWTNLQVQKNFVTKQKPRKNQPTTVAQILFKQGSDPNTNQVQRAFELSLNEKKIVCMQGSEKEDEPCKLS